MHLRIALLSAGLSALLSWADSNAETVYVSDQLVITLRAAPAETAEIINHLRTGDALEVLERPPSGNFVKVSTAAGETGWVLSQYVMPNPAARRRLPGVEADLSSQRVDAGCA